LRGGGKLKGGEDGDRNDGEAFRFHNFADGSRVSRSPAVEIKKVHKIYHLPIYACKRNKKSRARRGPV
jgi:hypothetical protein